MVEDDSPGVEPPRGRPPTPEGRGSVVSPPAASDWCNVMDDIAPPRSEGGEGHDGHSRPSAGGEPTLPGPSQRTPSPRDEAWPTTAPPQSIDKGGKPRLASRIRIGSRSRSRPFAPAM